jgi:hypothetical protein
MGLVPTGSGATPSARGDEAIPVEAIPVEMFGLP